MQLRIYCRRLGVLMMCRCDLGQKTTSSQFAAQLGGRIPAPVICDWAIAKKAAAKSLCRLFQTGKSNAKWSTFGHRLEVGHCNHQLCLLGQ